MVDPSNVWQNISSNFSTYIWSKQLFMSPGSRLHLLVNGGSVEWGPRCNEGDGLRMARGTSHSETDDTCLSSKPLQPQIHKRVLLMCKKAPKRSENQKHPTWWKETGETSKRTSVFKEGTSDFTILCGWKLPDVIKRTLYSATLQSSPDRHTDLNTHCLLSKDQGFLHHCSATGAPDTEWKLRASPPIHHRDTEEHLDGWEEITYRKQT